MATPAKILLSAMRTSTTASGGRHLPARPITTSDRPMPAAALGTRPPDTAGQLDRVGQPVGAGPRPRRSGPRTSTERPFIRLNSLLCGDSWPEDVIDVADQPFSGLIGDIGSGQSQCP